MRTEIVWKLSRLREDFWWAVAKMLPAQLKYVTFNLVFAHATTGKYGDTECSSVTCATVSQRFHADKLKD